MTPRHAEIIYAILRTGSVTDAAKLLNISQPAISAALKRCEDVLGLKLFERRNGRLIPTPETELIYPDIENVFSTLANMRALLSNHGHGKGGGVLVAVNTAIFDATVTEAFASFSRAFPNVHLTVNRMTTSKVIEAVTARRVDFGLGYLPSNPGSVRVEELRSDLLVCILPADHHLASRQDLGPSDLIDTPLITYRRGAIYGEVIAQAFESAGIKPRSVVTTNESMIVSLFAASGLGVGIAADLRGSSLFDGIVTVPFCPQIEVKLALFLPIDRALSANAKRLISTLRRWIAS